MTIAISVYTKLLRDIRFDLAKRAITLAERGLDFVDAPFVFADQIYTGEDDRFDYGEIRWVTYGYLDKRAVVVVWIECDGVRRIISMRHAHEEEMANVRLG
ncbi:MAG: BrnT family toxin [Sphingomonas sp.]